MPVAHARVGGGLDVRPELLARLFVYEPSAAATADLPALAAGRSRFVGRPFVRGPLLMCRAAALARDLALLLRRHRREPAAFFPFTCRTTVRSIIHDSFSLSPSTVEPRTT